MAKDNVAENVDTGVSESEWSTVAEPYPPTFLFKNEGDSLVGTYYETKTVEQDSLDGSGIRNARIYLIQSDDGAKHSVWGTYSLDQAFDSLNLGDYVRVVFDGKVPIDNGARSVNQFTVQVRK
jgi:hypothetical protein